MFDWFTQNFFFVYGFWLLVIGLIDQALEKIKSAHGNERIEHKH